MTQRAARSAGETPDLNERTPIVQTEESFDHLVRSSEQFEYLQDYIAKNPVKAGLRAGEYIHWRWLNRK